MFKMIKSQYDKIGTKSCYGLQYEPANDTGYSLN